MNSISNAEEGKKVACNTQCLTPNVQHPMSNTQCHPTLTIPYHNLRNSHTSHHETFDQTMLYIPPKLANNYKEKKRNETKRNLCKKRETKRNPHDCLMQEKRKSELSIPNIRTK